MSFMIRTVQKEKERIDYMIMTYEQQLDKLPKGSVTTKTVGNNIYRYLKYRNGKFEVCRNIGRKGVVS